MPLTAFQQSVARLLATNRTPDSHLAGGAALHLAPNSKRYSNDLDYFHDSIERVASAFGDDRALLDSKGYEVELDMNQPGFVRAVVRRAREATKVEWAHDSAWRFMPAQADEECGFRLHPIDIAVNKVLALAGRNEARDFLDVSELDRQLLPLGALCWAGAGKDPGFTPLSLLELLKRRGRHRPEEFARLHLADAVDPLALKTWWLRALEVADAFVRQRPSSEAGCLYYHLERRAFVAPQAGEEVGSGRPIVLHFGRPGGVLPRVDAGN